MFQDHPTVEQLGTFVRFGSRPSDPPRSHLQIVRHLLTDCLSCRHQLDQMGWSRERLDRLLYPAASWPVEPGEIPPPPDRYDYTRGFEKASESVSALLAPSSHPSLAPEALLEELELLRPEERTEKVKEDHFAHPAFIRFLVQRSHSSRYRDSELMMHYALLARNAAEACAPGRIGTRLLADLRAHGWRQWANSLRVAGKIQEAEEAFEIAQRYRKEGTGDPLLRAWLLEQLASLRIFQRRFIDAIDLADQAGETYQQLDELQNLASTLVQKAIAYLYAGEPESAVDVLNRSIPLIDQERDPYLLLAACHNLILCYVDLDQPEQALSLYFEGKELYKQFEDTFILLRTAWQEGRLLRDLGHLDGAEQALLSAREGFLQRDLGYEVAVISLDLAAIYIKLGQAERVRQTATEALPIFRALKVGRETLASLLQLQQVADQEQEALSLIQLLSSQLERLPRDKRATGAK